MPTTRGEARLLEVADGVHAYLQRGSWGYNNAGLITDGTDSLLVDTLYDSTLTRRMLDAMQRVVPAAARIDTVVNTHANGDHCWGNQVFSGSRIIASRAAAAEMRELPPRKMHALVGASRAISKMPPLARRFLRTLGKLGVPRIGALSEGAEFAVACFGEFDIGNVKLTLPTQTFDGDLTLEVGARQVQLIEVGPAHTKGDVIAFLPKQRVVFTGDLLFINSHPIIWEGPIANWIAACDRLLALDVDVVVPGHGPVTDKHGIQDTRDYWVEILDAAKRGMADRASPDDVARDMLGSRPDWNEAHRLVVNLDTAYRDLSNDRSLRDPVALFARMSRLESA